MAEAELFGHERGAFTDATVARAGRFEVAGHGTLYLDGVTALGSTAQAAILRVVEERQLVRLGGTSPTTVHARIIASASGDVTTLVATGAFRTDLYHRLSVLPLHIPPLRERPEEVAVLATRFVAELSQSLHRTAPRLSNSAKDALMRYRWPGNVRELRHVIERTLLNSTGPDIRVSDLPVDVLEQGEAYLAPTGATRPTLEDVERRYIELTLLHTRGSQTRAAAILGISRKSLWEKRKRYGLD